MPPYKVQLQGPGSVLNAWQFATSLSSITMRLYLVLASDDPDDPLPQRHRCVEIALELAVSGAPPHKRCDRDLRETKENINHLPSPTVGK